MSDFTLIESAYPTKDDRNKRLNRVFCTYKGEPRSISAYEHHQYPLDVSEIYLLPHTAYNDDTPWDSSKRLKISYVNNPDLNIFDIELGYMDTDHGPACLSRHPARTTAVGITVSNICDVSGRHNRSRINFYYYKPNFLEMVEGKYDDASEAWEKVRSSKAISRSVSKDLCLMQVEPGLFGLYRRGILLGVTTGLNPTFSVLDSRKKLARVYEDDILKASLKLS